MNHGMCYDKVFVGVELNIITFSFIYNKRNPSLHYYISLTRTRNTLNAYCLNLSLTYMLSTCHGREVPMSLIAKNNHVMHNVFVILYLY